MTIGTLESFSASISCSRIGQPKSSPMVMGIAVMRIKREFQHIDSHKLHNLGDREEAE